MGRCAVWYVVAVAIAAVCGCASLPPPQGRVESYAVADTAATRLGRAIAPSLAAHPGRIGVHALRNPHDAFAARVLLAQGADRTLDVQYYLWHDDGVGSLMLEALWRAAERGVRVRLLLDDQNTRGLDALLATMDAHPQIEVRLYNPLLQRRLRGLAYLTDFDRLNRRMHNKSFTADHRVSIVGGRNIGDEYFGAGAGALFADLDLLLVGSAVDDVERGFDLYWNSASAYPLTGFVDAASALDAVAFESRFAARRADPGSVAYVEAVARTPVVADLLGGRLALEWTTGRVLYDDPAKTLDTQDREDILLFPRLTEAIGRPEKSLDLVSPYFVPGDRGTEALVAMAARGVRVRVLTNSLASSDVGVVHAGYAKRRVELLRAGIELYELEPSSSPASATSRGWGSSGSARALHAKTYAVDGRSVFVGSFNFDPRSVRLNTEMGVVVDSVALARELARAFDEAVPRIAYRVTLASDGQSLEWIGRGEAGEVRYATEPGTTAMQRAAVRFFSVLPIDWLL